MVIEIFIAVSMSMRKKSYLAVILKTGIPIGTQ